MKRTKKTRYETEDYYDYCGQLIPIVELRGNSLYSKCSICGLELDPELVKEGLEKHECPNGCENPPVTLDLTITERLK